MNDDLDLERRALIACGYRVHVKERNGTRWLTAVKGLDVQYKHWHPLTNIHQAMRLLIDAERLCVNISIVGVLVKNPKDLRNGLLHCPEQQSAQGLIDAQCRAIVTACASLEAVR